MPELSMARLFARNASRFSRLFVRLHVNKDQTFGGAAAFGDYLNSQMAVIQLPPGQVANALEIQDSTGNAAPAQGNVLFAVDAAGNFTQGGVPSVKQCVVRVPLTAAQILTLNTVPVSLVAAPGAGIALQVDAMVFEFTYNPVQFTGGGLVGPVYHGQTTNHLSGGVAAATILAAANAYVSLGPPITAFPLIANTGIDLYAATGNFAAGNSTAVVKLWYSQITLG